MDNLNRPVSSSSSNSENDNIILGVLVLIILGLVGYFVFYKKKENFVSNVTKQPFNQSFKTSELMKIAGQKQNESQDKKFL